MRFWFLLLLPIWVFSSPSFSLPVDVKPDPPVADPVLPTEKDPIFGNSSSDIVAHSPDVAKGISFGPILDRFSSLKTSGKKGSTALIDYQVLVAATNNFSENNVLGEGGLGRVFEARFNNNLRAAVKEIFVDGQEAEREFELSDFGLAITGGSSTKASIKLSGTLGYVAPEYLLDGKLTDKSDVYAFGVVLLELLMGRKAVEKVAETQCQSIVTWVAAIAVLCVQPEPSYRPLITDVLHSFIPLVPTDLGGSLRVTNPTQ
ncbi:putative receptor-like protein kinase [Dorcoceras hygrometricum]|uniref:Putative receptor-like protein kinase n=1 Tax=Dorcoceras hygrometricum TaxID=472368 RepID=A0A2Z7ATC3_9LAMI|nr:putative receptor-like protein kinase [Dorcoceras hygrometricum]